MAHHWRRCICVAGRYSSDMALDLINRRNRMEPLSTGKRLQSLTDRDLLWFEKIHRHGALPSTYLIAYSRHLGYTADKRALDRLTDLFHEAATAHKAPYLDRPFQQHNTQLLYQPLVYDLRPAAKRALQEIERWQDFAPAHATGMWWHHDFMLSCFTASIELSCLAEPDDFQFMFHDEICARIGRQLCFEVEYKDANGKTRRQDLKPDRAFGIKYLKSNTTRYFLVEADRGTETVKSTDTGRKRLLDNDLQYRQFIGGLEYKQALQYEGGIVLLNIMTSERRMRNIMALVKPSNYMAFKALPVFGRVFRSPPVMQELFTQGWERPGRAGFFINQ